MSGCLDVWMSGCLDVWMSGIDGLSRFSEMGTDSRKFWVDSRDAIASKNMEEGKGIAMLL